MQYLLALAGATLVATALGWALAGRELGSMQAAFDARERFVANASHELRSPLTVIRTEADVTLSDPDADVDELRAMGRAVIGAADEMDALLEGLMVLARSGHSLPNRAYVDLAAAAGAAARRVRSAAACACGWSSSRSGVSGERQLLERLAGNLIENGVRYNAPGGFVAVRTSALAGGRSGARRRQLRPGHLRRYRGAPGRAVRARRAHGTRRRGPGALDRALGRRGPRRPPGADAAPRRRARGAGHAARRVR